MEVGGFLNNNKGDAQEFAGFQVVKEAKGVSEAADNPGNKSNLGAKSKRKRYATFFESF